MKFWRSKHQSPQAQERRLDQRKPSTISAAMYWEHNNTRQCRITSVSLTGMFLEMKEPDVNSGTMLQLYFHCFMDNATKRCCEWVRVVGARKNGVAVRFARFDNQHQSNIRLMLHQALSALPASPDNNADSCADHNADHNTGHNTGHMVTDLAPGITKTA